jgi:ribosomal protein S18 acetylase RimI-like enzyme
MEMAEFTLRCCTPDDTEGLSLIGQATFLESYAGIVDGRDILAHCQKMHSSATYAHWLVRPAARAYLVEAPPGNAPIGYLFMDEADLPVPDPQPTDYEIKRIYVLHRFQGTGLGSRLMEQAIATARGLSRTRLLLGVYGKNTAALAFYARHGFRQISTRRFHVGHHIYDDAVLARPV